MAKRIRVILFVGIALLITACKTGNQDVDLTGIQSDVTIKRFEKDLVAAVRPSTENGINQLKSEYGSFFDYFTYRVLGIPEGTDAEVETNLTLFVNDREIRELYAKVDSVYPNLDEIKNGIDSFLRHYQYYFEEKKVPNVVTYISAFNYAVITTDSVIGIGLDMFLGGDSHYYPQLGIPKYMFSRFSREYVVPSVVKAWFQSDYEQENVKKEFLSQMVYFGKLFYYLDAMLPSTADTLKTGYSAEQMKWCDENESRIWSFFIEKKMLFSTDVSEYSKFIAEGPSSNGFPKEAPARIGAWTGWQIVKMYMKKHSDVTLEQLLAENDALKILEESGYKPQR